jgi:NAD(P)-dependent dehydrogenase (short-subunit alcohol dehydrogenase family)
VATDGRAWVRDLIDGTIDYGAAKAAMTDLSEALAEELGPKGVRVNTIATASHHQHRCAAGDRGDSRSPLPATQ